MTAAGIVIISLFGALACVVIREDFKSGAMLLSVSCCVLIYFFALKNLIKIRSDIEIFRNIANTDDANIALILKILVIAYVTGFCADICEDAGEKSISSAVELGGKILILAASFPMLCTLLKNITDLLG